MSAGRRLYAWCAAAWLYRFVASLAMVFPLWRPLSRPLRHLEGGELALWEPGGIWLLDVVREVRPLVGGAAVEGGLVLVGATLGWFAV
ncbi:MAG: hypothetical protein AAGA56_09885, partial [Myxococcota bacterium]